MCGCHDTLTALNELLLVYQTNLFPPDPNDRLHCLTQHSVNRPSCKFLLACMYDFLALPLHVLVRQAVSGSSRTGDNYPLGAGTFHHLNETFLLG